MTSETPVALVTGASRGIGAACAERLAATGMHVYVNCSKSTDAAGGVVARIAEAGGSAEVLVADVSDEVAVRTMVRTVKAARGRLDVLVNNAGITADGYVLAMSTRKWASVLDVDLTGAFLCSREAAKLMVSRGSGSIVNVSSVSGVVPPPGQANYAAAKAGLLAFGRSLAAEVAAKGVRVNSVVPGYIETPMLRTMPAGLLAEAMRLVPLGRTGSADEVAAAVAWLAGPEASYVTGATLVVDGGMTRQ